MGLAFCLFLLIQDDATRDLQHVNPDVRRFTCSLLGHRGAKTAIRPLIDLLGREDKDGVKAEFGITPDDCLALWREVLKNNLETLVNASAQDASPDQSQFTVKYRVWQTAGGFSADGVDSLPDDRYRKIVRAILTVADRYLRTGGR